MKKILIIMHSLYNGGAERSVVNMLCELPKEEFDVDLLLFERKGMFLEQVPDYVNVLETPIELSSLYDDSLCSPWKKMWKAYANVVSRLSTKDDRERRAYRWKHFYGPSIKTIIDNDYDSAVAYIGGEIFYFLDEKVRAKRKAVWIHNDYKAAGHPRKYDYEHLKNMDAIVSISNSCVNILKDEFPEFADKIYMIENITSSKVTRERAEEFYPKEYDNTPTVLSIGRLSEQKGFDMAIEAASILKSKGTNFKWIIIGHGELEDKLNAQIKELNVGDCVKLIGARENPYPYIKNATIFAQTSRYEGKSVVLDEAKILGATILATNYPTVNDQLQNGIEGHIVEMNAKGIAEGVDLLLRDEEYRKKLSGYLLSREYGNQDEINKYIEVIG